MEALVRGIDNMNVNIYRFFNQKADIYEYVVLSDFWKIYQVNPHGLETIKSVTAELPHKGQSGMFAFLSPKIAQYDVFVDIRFLVKKSVYIDIHIIYASHKCLHFLKFVEWGIYRFKHQIRNYIVFIDRFSIEIGLKIFGGK
jgi:hypothetical protein